MKRWILFRGLGFAAFTYFLLRYTVDGHFNLYDLIHVAILVAIVVNGVYIRALKSKNKKNA